MAEDWKERADAIVGGVIDYTDLTAMGVAGLALVNERLDAEGLRGKVWMVMPYECGKCRTIHYYEVEVGVEGPKDWRDDGTYIASPFGGETCKCGGVTTHLFRDQIFEPLREPGETFTGLSGLPTHASRFFRVPREPVVYATQGCDDDGNVIYGDPSTHAFLSTPMHTIRRAMQARGVEPSA